MISQNDIGSNRFPFHFVPFKRIKENFRYGRSLKGNIAMKMHYMVLMCPNKGRSKTSKCLSFASSTKIHAHTHTYRVHWWNKYESVVDATELRKYFRSFFLLLSTIRYQGRNFLCYFTVGTIWIKWWLVVFSLIFFFVCLLISTMHRNETHIETMRYPNVFVRWCWLKVSILVVVVVVVPLVTFLFYRSFR